jgi:hypothetical protein
MNTDIRNISSLEEVKQQEQVIVEQIRRTQQFGRMPERHKPSYIEMYHYQFRENTELPDERED